MELYIISSSGKTEFNLGGGQYSLGSAEDNAIQIGHTTVSGHHAVMDISESGQVLIKSLIPSGMSDSDGDIQDMITLFPGDFCSIGQVTVGRESLVASPPNPPAPPTRVTSVSTTSSTQQQPAGWIDIFHYPFREDALTMMVILFVLDNVLLLVPRFLFLAAAFAGIILMILYALTILGTVKEIIQSTLEGENNLNIPLADSFDLESSKELFCKYFLLGLVWIGIATFIAGRAEVPMVAKIAIMMIPMVMFPMAVLLVVLNDSLGAGFYMPAIIQSIFRAPMAYLGIILLVALSFGCEYGLDLMLPAAGTGKLMRGFITVITSCVNIYFTLVIARALGLYAHKYMRN